MVKSLGAVAGGVGGSASLGAPLSKLDDETLLRVASGCCFQNLGVLGRVVVFCEKLKTLEGASTGRLGNA